MDQHAIGAYKRAQPFRPFVIHTGSGGDYLVEHPENFAFAPDSPVAVVFGGPPHYVTMIDLASITEITYPAKPSGKKSRSGGRG